MNTRALVPEDLRRDLGAADRRLILRTVTAFACAAARRESPEQTARSLFGRDDQVAHLTRAASSPIESGDFPIWTARTVLPAIAPASAAARLFAMATSVNLDDVTSVKLPGILNVAPAIFIAEGEPAPALQYAFSAPSIGPTKKILLQAVVSGELETASGDVATVLIARALSEAATKGLDAVALGSGAATDAAPAGLLSGVTPLTATAGGGIAAAAGDLAKAVAVMASAGVDGSDAVIITRPELAVKLLLQAGPRFTTPILSTIAIAAGTAIIIAPAGVVSAYSGAPTVESSKEAVVHFEDTTPLPISTTTVAAPTRSAFQSDLIVVKLRARAAWAALPGAVQFFSNVTW